MFIDKDGKQILEDYRFPVHVRRQDEDGNWVDDMDYIVIPYGNLAIWGEDDLAIYGITSKPDPVPPPPVKDPNGPVSKADIWRRMTDAEAVMADQALASAPAKERRMYDAAQVIVRDDPYWPILLAGMTQIFGQVRALEILAPSE